MIEPERKITKTGRILSVYYLLQYCEEVSMQELTGLLPGSKKTFSRDIALLKKAGFPVRYSVRRHAFVLDSNLRTAFCATENKTKNKAEQIFIKKIIRLATMIDEIPEMDCDKWYTETFPQASKRTMQRDFATLNAIGYRIKYERESFNSHDAGLDVPRCHYYCDRPYGTYELTTFNKAIGI